MGAERLEMDETDNALMEDRKWTVSSPPVNKYERLYQPCVAETLGTMFFVFISCVSVIENVPAAGRLQPALVHGLAVVVMVAAMEKVSGSHFNPSFTIAIYLCGGMELMMVGPYIVCQLIGGVLGAGMAKMMTPVERYDDATGAAFDIVTSEEQLFKAVFGEVAMTCLVTTVLLLVAVNGKTKTPQGPFLVGCSVVICVLAGSDVSGACLNPVRAFGPAVMTNYWTYHWVYWVGPTGGGLLASGLVRVILGDKKTRVIMKS